MIFYVFGGSKDSVSEWGTPNVTFQYSATRPVKHIKFKSSTTALR